MTLSKSECRNPKYETNSKSKVQIHNPPLLLLPFEELAFRNSNLFRISRFGFGFAGGTSIQRRLRNRACVPERADVVDGTAVGLKVQLVDVTACWTRNFDGSQSFGTDGHGLAGALESDAHVM